MGDKTPNSEAKGTTSPAKKDGAKEEKSLFTPKEEHFLKIAMANCLEGGPPKIDMDRFVKFGEFNTMKTAQNTWGKIKGKLAQTAAANKKDSGAEEGEGEGEAITATPKTPKTPKTPGSKKRGKKADAEGTEDGAAAAGEADASPKKKRKTPVKKTAAKEVKVEEDGDADADAAADTDGDEIAVKPKVEAEDEDGE